MTLAIEFMYIPIAKGMILFTALDNRIFWDPRLEILKGNTDDDAEWEEEQGKEDIPTKYLGLSWRTRQSTNLLIYL